MRKLLTILCIGLSFVSQAQQTISGTITNNQNEPLFGVEVFVEELQNLQKYEPCLLRRTLDYIVQKKVK